MLQLDCGRPVARKKAFRWEVLPCRAARGGRRIRARRGRTRRGRGGRRIRPRRGRTRRASGGVGWHKRMAGGGKVATSRNWRRRGKMRLDRGLGREEIEKQRDRTVFFD